VGFRPGGESVELCLGPAAAAVEIPVHPLPGEKTSVFVSAVPLAGDGLVADENERRRWRTGDTIQTATSLWISRLPAGTYRLVVRCSAVPGPVHAMEVVVRGGDDVVRLAPIDLADHVREVPVRVLLHDGLPVREGRVTVFGDENSKTTRTLRDGTATLWLDRPRDVEVRLPDGTAHRFEAVFAETELRLPPRER
jgi:hypothetical protein